MTPSSTRLVQQSFKQLLAERKLTANAFLSKLSATAPGLVRLLPRDHPGEWRRLLAAFAFTIESLDDFDMMLPALRIAGSRYRGLGLGAEEYTLFGIALINTLEDALGADWTPKLHHAWDEAFVAIVTAMQDRPEAGVGSGGEATVKIER